MLSLIGKRFAGELIAGLFLLVCGSLCADETKTLRVGIIGLDTSHCPAFTKAMNDPKATGDLAKVRVVAAYPQGSRDIPSSTSRVPKYTAELRGLGIEIVDSIPALLTRVDAVLLESNDGRPHLEQLIPVLKAGKPTFIDKPVAASLSDTIAIFELAKFYKTPVFTSSSLRWIANAAELRSTKHDVTTWSPCHIEKTHPDLFWYGIHGVEALYAAKGPGCVSLKRTHSANADLVEGVWKDGSKGVFRGYRGKGPGYGGEAQTVEKQGGEKKTIIGPYKGYRPLVEAIAHFFVTGEKPVSDEESIEIYTFMQAAQASRESGGAEVLLADVRKQARFEIGDGFLVDSDYPGGNGTVRSIEGATVKVEQELRDTSRWWFWWNFRVRGAAGRTLRFEFPKPSPIGVHGPAVSLDAGATWTWLGAESVDASSFTYNFPASSTTVRFAFAPPYLERDLDRFLSTLSKSTPAHFERSTLTRSRRGREVEKLRFGFLKEKPKHRVLLTARHHACESMASYALEGIIAQVLADDEDGAWLRDNVEFLAIPFVDKDGVEAGDQGKLRRPHDHNRDYLTPAIYPEVQAIRDSVPAWSKGRLKLGIDLHCPWIRGGEKQAGGNETIFFVGVADERFAAPLESFGIAVEKSLRQSLPYEKRWTLKAGQSWNRGEDLPKMAGAWMSRLPGIELATTLELPYANASGVAVTPATARAFGRDLARAIRTWLAR